MKHLLLLLLAVSTVLLSCNKGPHEWTCTTVTEVDYIDNEVIDDYTTTVVEQVTHMSDKNYDEVFIEQNTSHVDYTAGYSETKTCTCIKQ